MTPCLKINLPLENLPAGTVFVRCSDVASKCLSAKTKMTIIVVFHQALRSSVVPLVMAIPSSGRGLARTPFQGPCLL